MREIARPMEEEPGAVRKNLKKEREQAYIKRFIIYGMEGNLINAPLIMQRCI